MPPTDTSPARRAATEERSRLFPGWFLGGFECSTHVTRVRRHDLTAVTAHDRYADEDYARLVEAGIRAARDGLRWHRVEARPGRYDFRCDLPMIRAAAAHGVRTVWDLCHYGWPDDLEIWSPAFVERFARFARAAAEVVAGETDGVPLFSPINEISFFAWAGGDAGYLLPFANGRADELKRQLVRAAIAAIEAIREVAPRARIVHVDPIIHIAADPSRPEGRLPAARHTAAQFHAWDMLAGRRHPELGGRPEYLDVIGVNVYHNNQWIHEGPTLWRDDPLFRPLRSLLAEVYDRYGRPLFIAETGAESFMRPEWLSYVGREARAAIGAGVPLEGICWYPILEHPGWDDDRHCPNGLWGYADPDGHRAPYRPLLDQLERQRKLFFESDAGAATAIPECREGLAIPDAREGPAIPECREGLLPLLLVGNGIVGGMEQYVLGLLREFRRRGQRALVAAPFMGEFTDLLFEQGHPPEDFHLLDMRWHEVDFPALAQLVTVLRTRKVDVIHSHLQPADLLGAAAAAATGVPLVVTLHGMLHTRDEVLIHDLCGAEFITVSEAGEANAIGAGLRPGVVRHIPNGVDAARFDPAAQDRDAVRRGLGLVREDVLVTTVSRLSSEKNPRGFVNVAALAGARNERLVFALAGTGPEEPAIRRARRHHPARDRLRLLGERRDVPELLAGSDVFALTSRTESLPFAVLEAMAMRLPVVCYDVGGLAEVVRDGANGFLVPFGDEEAFSARLLELAADAGLRRRIGEAARATILARHGFAAIADAILEAYRDRVARAGRARAADVQAAAPKGAAGAERLRALDIPVVDGHLHLSGGESAERVLETLDAAGIRSACLIAPFLEPGEWVPMTGAALRRANRKLLRLIETAPERLWGLVSVDPRSGSAVRELEELAACPAVRGLKLIPHEWRVEDPGALRLYEACEALGLPILFHSGIFIGGRTSDHCRPARYEVVRRFPGLRVVLAHLGWPWTDEAIAVAHMDPLKGRAPQILLDTSPGTPPVYRPEALRRALAVLGPELLLWGCDRFLPIEPGTIRRILDEDVRSLVELGVGEEDLRRIFSENAAAIFRPRSGTAAPSSASRPRPPGGASPAVSRPVDFGDLARTGPITRDFGFERGLPVDRFYIERFLERHAADVRGRVLEVGDAAYTRRFGGERVDRSDVLHAEEGNPDATIVADLASGEALPDATFDCFICTQTLTYVWPLREAVRTIHRILRPGGVVLASVPGISQISRHDMDRWGEFWRLTELSARRLFEEAFGEGHVEVEAHGNVLAASAFLYGLATEDLEAADLEHRDPDYPLVVTVRATRGGRSGEGPDPSA